MFAKLILRSLVVSLLAHVSLLVAFAQAPPSTPRSELVADQIVETFYTTLDFGEVYRKWWVKSPQLRKAEMQLQIGGFLAQGDHFAGSDKPLDRNIDEDAMERAFIAWGNFHWNSATAIQSRPSKDRTFELGTDAVWKKYHDPFSEASTWPIVTSKELDERFTPRFVSLAEFFRKNVVKANLTTEWFKKLQADFHEDKPPDSTEYLIEYFALAGMTSKDHLFVARRGQYYLYLIEEDGELRLFSFGARNTD
jgi:hypothetical protein